MSTAPLIICGWCGQPPALVGAPFVSCPGNPDGKPNHNFPQFGAVVAPADGQEHTPARQMWTMGSRLLTHSLFLSFSLCVQATVLLPFPLRLQGQGKWLLIPQVRCMFFAQ
jgi:hypothetical protein